MLQKTLGIVLHTLKYNDTSLIADIYTETAGRASFIVKIPRSRKAAVKSVLFQPFALVELEADFRSNVSMYKITEAKSYYPFSSIPYDPYKSSIALSWRSSCIVRCAKRLRTVRCLLICNILLSGWTSAAIVLPISIWCS